MSLKKTLQKQNYDLIQGPIRDEGLLQIWKKKDLESIHLYERSIDKAFEQEFTGEPFENKALSITSSEKQEFDFTAGIGFINNALVQFNIANANLETHFKSGKNVTVSYDNSFTKEVTELDIEKYLTKVDTSNLIHSMLTELNRNHLFVISGVVFAKNLDFVINSNHNIDAEIEAQLNKIGQGKINFQKTGDQQISMKSTTNEVFPIAVKAYRMHFVKSKFKKLELVTDNRNLF